jgi:hypothetical protein
MDRVNGGNPLHLSCCDNHKLAHMGKSAWRVDRTLITNREDFVDDGTIENVRDELAFEWEHEYSAEAHDIQTRHAIRTTAKPSQYLEGELACNEEALGPNLPNGGKGALNQHLFKVYSSDQRPSDMFALASRAIHPPA